MDPDLKLILIVWEQGPEKSGFVVRQVDELELKKLQSWHGKYLDSPDEPKQMYDYFFTLEFDENGEAYQSFRFQKIRELLHEVKYDSIVRMGSLL